MKTIAEMSKSDIMIIYLQLQVLVLWVSVITHRHR